MKKYILLCLLFFQFISFSFGQQIDYIEIQHTGLTSKEIDQTFITKQKIEGSQMNKVMFLNPIISDAKSYDALKAFVRKYEFKLTGGPFEYGEFRIHFGTMTRDKVFVSETYYLTRRSLSVIFFKNLSEYLKSCKCCEAVLSSTDYYLAYFDY